MIDKDEDIDNGFEDDGELEINEIKNNNEVKLDTHIKINSNYSGEIQKLEVGYAEVKLVTLREMVADEFDLIHGGFIFCVTDYAAMLAVNEKNVVLVASDCQFLSPVKFGDIVNVIARVRHKEGRKRNVHVTAHVHDIKVFDGEFKTVVTDRHVLKLKLMEEKEEEE
ncbi:MAG: PaaI family thioesterase [Sulfurimonas sp.]|nr:PaaI family thioesterase [Sulfurimonas sp.]